jgi:hypothetical protein
MGDGKWQMANGKWQMAQMPSDVVSGSALTLAPPTASYHAAA